MILMAGSAAWSTGGDLGLRADLFFFRSFQASPFPYSFSFTDILYLRIASFCNFRLAGCFQWQLL